MEAIIARWLLEQDIAQLQRLAVDGKVLRGTGREDGKPLALLSVVTHHLRATLRSVPIAEKSNEIPAIKPLLAGLSIEGSLLTADAMHCQQETARLITQDHGADYIFGLKGNQSGVLERATTKLASVFFPPESDAPWNKGHGKLVRRRIKTLATTPEDIGLTGCWRVIAVERTTIDLTLPKLKQKPETEIAYYVSSRTKAEASDGELLDAKTATEGVIAAQTEKRIVGIVTHQTVRQNVSRPGNDNPAKAHVLHLIRQGVAAYIRYHPVCSSGNRRFDNRIQRVIHKVGVVTPASHHRILARASIQAICNGSRGNQRIAPIAAAQGVGVRSAASIYPIVAATAEKRVGSGAPEKVYCNCVG